MPPEFNTHFSNFFRSFTQQLATIIPPNTDLSAAYENGTDDQQAFVQNLALFYTGFFRVSRALPCFAQQANRFCMRSLQDPT